MTRSKPYAGTELSAYVTHRINELRPRKSQAEIAAEAGFVNPNMISMLKAGSAKLALDRVPALAAALECDPARLYRLALMQTGMETAQAAILEVFGAVVSRNEAAWLAEIRDASGNSDPALTSRGRTAIRGVFGK